MKKSDFYFVLSLISGIGLRSFHKRLLKYDSYEDFWNSLFELPLKVQGKSYSPQDLIHLRDEQLEVLEKQSVHFISYDSPHFPQVFKDLTDPPLGFYVRGQKNRLVSPHFAVIGTRYPTLYGRRMAEKFSNELSEFMTIVSGLALGVDGYAHRSALHSPFSTIAILGSGLGEIYPKNHIQLSEEIVAQGGLLISEYPVKMKAMGRLFPRRNRLISALCTSGVLIVEGAIKSGSMVTAQYALKQGRPLYAIPGSIGVKQAEAPLSLIAKGQAQLVRSISDIQRGDRRVDTFSDLFNQSVSQSSVHSKKESDLNLNQELKSVFEILYKNVLYFDEIVTMVPNLGPRRLHVVLAQLESKGLCEKKIDGRWYRKGDN